MVLRTVLSMLSNLNCSHSQPLQQTQADWTVPDPVYRSKSLNSGLQRDSPHANDETFIAQTNGSPVTRKQTNRPLVTRDTNESEEKAKHKHESM